MEVAFTDNGISLGTYIGTLSTVDEISLGIYIVVP
jgi:hypothetical protein